MTNLSNEQILASFERYVSKHPSQSFADLCSPEQAASFARLMSESTGLPLAKLTVATIKEFKPKLRRDVKLRGSLTLYRALLAVELFLAFKRDVLKKNMARARQ